MFIATSSTIKHLTPAGSYVYRNAGTSKKFDSGWSRINIMLPIFYKHAIPAWTVGQAAGIENTKRNNNANRPQRGRMCIATGATSKHRTPAGSYVYSAAGTSKRKFDSGWSRMNIVLPIFYTHLIPPELINHQSIQKGIHF
jgi:hypothetical protein